MADAPTKPLFDVDPKTAHFAEKVASPPPPLESERRPQDIPPFSLGPGPAMQKAKELYRGQPAELQDLQDIHRDYEDGKISIRERNQYLRDAGANTMDGLVHNYGPFYAAGLNLIKDVRLFMDNAVRVAEKEQSRMQLENKKAIAAKEPLPYADPEAQYWHEAGKAFMHSILPAMGVLWDALPRTALALSGEVVARDTMRAFGFGPKMQQFAGLMVGSAQMFGSPGKSLAGAQAEVGGLMTKAKEGIKSIHQELVKPRIATEALGEVIGQKQGQKTLGDNIQRLAQLRGETDLATRLSNFREETELQARSATGAAMVRGHKVALETAQQLPDYVKTHYKPLVPGTVLNQEQSLKLNGTVHNWVADFNENAKKFLAGDESNYESLKIELNNLMTPIGDIDAVLREGGRAGEIVKQLSQPRYLRDFWEVLRSEDAESFAMGNDKATFTNLLKSLQAIGTPDEMRQWLHTTMEAMKGNTYTIADNIHQGFLSILFAPPEVWVKKAIGDILMTTDSALQKSAAGYMSQDVANGVMKHEGITQFKASMMAIWDAIRQGFGTKLYRGGETFDPSKVVQETGQAVETGVSFSTDPNIAQQFGKVTGYQLKRGANIADGEKIASEYAQSIGTTVEELKKYPTAGAEQLAEFAKSRGYQGVDLSKWVSGEKEIRVFDPSIVKEGMGPEDLKGLVEGLPNWTGHYHSAKYAYPLKVFESITDFAQTLNIKAGLYGYYWRQGVRQGLEGEALANFIARESRTPNLAALEEATTMALDNTALAPLGQFAKRLKRVTHDIPYVGPYIFPVFTVGANLTNRALANVPGANLFTRNMLKDLAAGGRPRDMALGRLFMADLAGYFFTGMGKMDALTGSGPPSAAAAQVHRHAGYPRHSILLGGSWLGYDPAEPLGKTMAVLADLAYNMDYTDGQSALNIGAAAASAVLKDSMESSYWPAFTGMMRYFENLEKGDIIKGVGGLLGTAAGPVTNVLGGGPIVQRFQRQFDPWERNYRGEWDRFKISNPITNMMIPTFFEDVPYQHDIFTGEKIPMPAPWGAQWFNNTPARIASSLIQPFTVAPVEKNPRYQTIEDLGVKIPRTDFVIAGKDAPVPYGEPSPTDGPQIRLTTEQQEDLIHRMSTIKSREGRTLADSWDYVAAKLEQRPNATLADKKDIHQQVIEAYWSAAKEQMFRDRPDLQLERLSPQVQRYLNQYQDPEQRAKKEQELNDHILRLDVDKPISELNAAARAQGETPP